MKNIADLHPRLQAKLSELQTLCSNNGITIKIGECLRTVAEQDALYAKGRTTTGSIVTNAKGSSYSSQHQWGIAADFYLHMDVDGDGLTSDDAFNNVTGLFDKVGSLAKSIGLGWGGDWKSPVDKPHLYLPDWGSTTKSLKEKYKTPEKFIATWGNSNTSTTSASSNTTTTTSTRSYLMKGDRGDLVRELQNNLNELGYSCGSADGIFGDTTDKAVRTFQSAYGLTVDGKYGNSSKAKMNEALNAKRSGNSIIKVGQTHANNFAQCGLNPDGIRGAQTKKAAAKVLQRAMNLDYNAGLIEDGEFGVKSKKALGSHYVKLGESQYMVTALEILLMLKGIDSHGVECPGKFGNGLATALGKTKCDSTTFLSLLQ